MKTSSLNSAQVYETGVVLDGRHLDAPLQLSIVKRLDVILGDFGDRKPFVFEIRANRAFHAGCVTGICDDGN